jgi:predicted site-specific integrase-resolvase
MAKPRKRETKADVRPLEGWQQIATFLGLPVSTAQRWAKSGMPVTREGRRVKASPEDLNHWMGQEALEPVRIATESADLSSELRRGLSYVKKQKQAQTKNIAA